MASGASKLQGALALTAVTGIGALVYVGYRRHRYQLLLSLHRQLLALGHACLPPPGLDAVDCNASSEEPSQQLLQEALTALQALHASLGDSTCGSGCGELLKAAEADVFLRLNRPADARAALHVPNHASQPAELGRLEQLWRQWVQVQCSWLADADSPAEHLSQLVGKLRDCEAPAEDGSSGGLQAWQQGALLVIARLPSSAAAASLLSSCQQATTLAAAAAADVRAGRLAAAGHKFDAALQEPGLGPAVIARLHYNRSTVHLRECSHAKAVLSCCRALAVDPSHAGANLRLASILTDLRCHTQAAHVLEAAAERLQGEQLQHCRSQLAQVRQRAAAPLAFKPARGVAALDCYRLLGVEHECGPQEVLRAYKQMSLYLHPDKAAGGLRLAERCCGAGAALVPMSAAAERLHTHTHLLFTLLADAKDSLVNEGKRCQVDRLLGVHRRPKPAPAPPAQPAPTPPCQEAATEASQPAAQHSTQRNAEGSRAAWTARAEGLWQQSRLYGWWESFVSSTG